MAKQNQDEDIKRCMGMPMRWNRKRMFKNLWNKTDPRVLPPKYFGIGWDINFHALLKRLRIIDDQDTKGKS